MNWLCKSKKSHNKKQLEKAQFILLKFGDNFSQVVVYDNTKWISLGTLLQEMSMRENGSF